MNNMSLFENIRAQRKTEEWQHFTYNKAEEKAKHPVCSAIIKAPGISTKNLIIHLKSKHQFHIKSCLEKSVTGPPYKKRKINSLFYKRSRIFGKSCGIACGYDDQTFN